MEAIKAHIITVDTQAESKILTRKLYKKFGFTLQSVNCAADDKYEIYVVRNEELPMNVIGMIMGYAAGILEWIKSVEEPY